MHQVSYYLDWFKKKFIGILVGILGSLLLFRPILFVKPGSFLWADSFDSKLLYWTANWGYHILFELGRPLSFWNANSFYPAANTLAYSDSVLSLQLFFAPFRALGIDPLTSLYLSLAGFAVLGCFFTERALRRIGSFSSLEIAIVVFATHFGLSLNGFMYHYQLFGFHLAPGFVLYLYLYLRDLRKKELFILCCLFCLGTAFATYLAPMLLVIAMFLVVPCLIFRLYKKSLREYISRIGWASLVMVLLFALLLYFVQIKPYLAMLNNIPLQGRTAYMAYSASLFSIFNGFSIYSYWYSPGNYSIYGQWESSYFPGLVLLSFASLFLLSIASSLIFRLFPKFQKVRLFQSDLSSEEKFFIGYMIFFFLLVLFFSLGPYIKDVNIKSYPYRLVSRIIPGVANIRAPGRFGAWIGLPLSVFLIFVIRQAKMINHRKSWILGVLLLLLVLESIPNYPIFPFSVDPKQIYQKVAQFIQPGEVVLELPVFGKDYIDTLRNVQNQLVGSTIAWQRLLVGYGAGTTSDYDRLIYLDSILHDGGDIKNMADFAHSNGVNDVLIYLPAYPETTITQWRDFSKKSSVCKLFETKGYILLRLDNGTCPPVEITP